jgi:hypothetical protein
VNSDRLEWHQEFVTTVSVGAERVEYRIIPVPAETGGQIVFHAIVKDEQSGAKPGLFAGFIATMKRSDFSCPCFIGFDSSPSRCGPLHDN